MHVKTVNGLFLYVETVTPPPPPRSPLLYVQTVNAFFLYAHSSCMFR